MGHEQHTSAPGGHVHVGHTDVINTTVIALWAVGIVAGFGIVVLALVMYFGDYTRKHKEKVVELGAYKSIAAEYWRSRLAADSALGKTDAFTYSWVDAKAGTVAIPLDAAKTKVIEVYARRPRPEGAGAMAPAGK